MKSILFVLMVATGIVGTRGDAVSCSVIDYLYYSSDCCDNSNSVQCMESIPQTDKAAIDNLATLKRSDGAACQSGDSINYYSDANFTGLVCTGGAAPAAPAAPAATTAAPAATTAAPAATTAAPAATTAAPAATTAAPAATTAAPAATTAAPTLTLHVDATGYSSADVLSQQECFDNEGAILTAVLALRSDTTITSWHSLPSDAAGLTNDGAGYPKGCYIRVKDNATPDYVQYRLFFNNDATGADPFVSGNYHYIGITQTTAAPAATTAAPAATTAAPAATTAAPAAFEPSDYRLSDSADTYTATYGAHTPLTQAECEIYTNGRIALGDFSDAMEVRNDDTTPAHCVWSNDDSKVIFQQKSTSTALLDGSNAVPYQAIVKQNCHGRGDCVSGTGCANKWQCADGACVSNACAATLANGAACSDDDECQNVCIDHTGQCDDRQADGATCADIHECANTCLSTTNQCGARLANGVACGTWSDCDSGNCDGGVCAM